MNPGPHRDAGPLGGGLTETERTLGAVQCRRVVLDIDGFYRKRCRKAQG
jgi:hypothetical protein